MMLSKFFPRFKLNSQGNVSMRALWRFLFLTMFCCISAGAVEWKAEKIADIAGLDGPECMLPDPERDVVYVSNIETSTGEYWADDGSGFISIMTPQGEIKERRWADTSPETVLNAPKGMCILKGYLYFSDNGHLRRCSVGGGQALQHLLICFVGHQVTFIVACP